LQDLSAETIGTASGSGNDDESNFTDDIEEEFCEAERYKDLEDKIKEDEKQAEIERGKGAEISFSYEEENDDDGISEGSDEEEEKEYETPTDLKLPVGITLVRRF
jgi:hypothetical protein